MAETITLSTCLYNGREQIRITFPYSYRAKECVRVFPGTRWSPENHFWYLKDMGAAASLIAHLQAGGFGVQSLKAAAGTQAAKSLPKSHPLVVRFRQFLEARRFTAESVDTYTTFIRQFLEYLENKPPGEATSADAASFLETLVRKRRVTFIEYRRAIRSVRQFAVFFQEGGINPANFSKQKEVNFYLLLQ